MGAPPTITSAAKAVGAKASAAAINVALATVVKSFIVIFLLKTFGSVGELTGKRATARYGSVPAITINSLCEVIQDNPRCRLIERALVSGARIKVRSTPPVVPPKRLALPHSFLTPNAIAQNYLSVLKQPRSAWTWEIELRPWVEKF